MTRSNKKAEIPRVVVVNDDLTQLNILHGLLQKAGLDPLPFRSAEAALEALRLAPPPELIVTDLYMPGIDGWRFCRLLRSPEYSQFNQIPILVVSATFSGDEPARITSELGANAFLPMPVDGEQFIETIQALLQGKQRPLRPRVLVVEDSKMQQERMVKAFQAHGYQPDAAGTCQEAHHCMKNNHYDVLILDYHLPDGEGDSLLAETHAKHPNCVCIMMTADTRSDLALQWLSAGAAAYIRKPFEPEYLITECERARRERALLRIQDLLEVRTRQLQESKEKYQRLSEDMPAFISSFLPDGTLTYVNRALADLAGTTPDALMGQCFFNLLSPEDRALVEKRLPALSPEKPVETHEQTHATQGGSPRIVQWTNRAFFDESGRAIAFQASGIDITARKQMEEELRLTRSRYEAVLETQTDLVCRWLPDTTMTYVNEAYCNYFNRTREELLGTRFISFLPEETARIVQGAVECLSGGKEASLRRDELNFDAQGTKRWVQWVYRAIRDEQGKVIEFQSVGRDITGRRLMEQSLRLQHSLGVQLNSAKDTAEAMRLILATCLQFESIDSGGVYVLDPEDGCLKLIDHHGLSADFIAACSVYPADAPEILLARKGQIIYGEYKDIRQKDDQPRRAEGLQSLAVLPFLAGGELMAILNLASHTQSQFPDPVRLTLETMLGQLSTVIERIQAEESLRESEENHRLLVSGLPDVIMRFDRDGRHLFVSPNVRRVVDIDAEHFIGKTHTELGFPEAQCRFWEESIRGVIESGKPFETEFTFGEVPRRVVFNWRLLPELDAQGSVCTVLSISRDITERKQLEEELALKSLVLDQIQDHVTITDLQGKITYVNESEIRTLGIAREQLIGQATSVYGEDAEKGATQRDIVENTLRDGSWRCEIVNYASDGNKIIMDCRTQVIQDAEGKAIALCGIATDITERKRLENVLNNRLVALTRPLDEPEGIQFSDLFNLEEIQKLQDQFSTATGVASIITHPDGTPITQPSNFCSLCNEIIRKTEIGKHNCFQSDAVIGKYQPGGPIIQPCLSGGLWDAGAGIAVGGRHIANWLIGQVRNEAQSEEKIREYARLIGADENDAVSAFQQVPAMSMMEFEQAANALFLMAKLLSDIAYQNVQQARFIHDLKTAESRLSQSEERYRLIDQASQDLIYSYDRQSRFTHANLSLCKLLGLEREQILGKTHEDLDFPQEQCMEWARLHQKVYDTNSTVISESITPIQGGAPHYFEVMLNPIHDQTGAIIGIAGTTRDINARKLAEKKINEQLAELKRWHSITLGREDRIMQLKRDINQLLAEAGKPPRFASATGSGTDLLPPATEGRTEDENA